MGTLDGFRIVELAGIGPAPFCGMLLADMGADVLRIDRTQPAELGVPIPTRYDVLNRNKRSIAVDLKSAEGIDTVLRLVDRADALIEGFRPGVTERLGIGPDACLARNGRLVYGRMTGWGQTGSLAQAAGHDINYIALAGALHGIGRKGQPPTPPLNLVGDFGGGALYLAVGVLAGLLESRASGKGQVVDAAMIDGAASLMSIFFAFRQMNYWSLERGTNVLDSGAHFYDVYETLDGRYVAVGAIESRFYRTLLELAGLGNESLPQQNDASHWDSLRKRLAEVFKTKTRARWVELMEGTDACFAPVLDLDEVADHPHNRERDLMVDLDGVTQPSPAPRFSRTPSRLRNPPPAAGQDTQDALADWGFSPGEVRALLERRVVAGASVR